MDPPRNNIYVNVINNYEGFRTIQIVTFLSCFLIYRLLNSV